MSHRRFALALMTALGFALAAKAESPQAPEASETSEAPQPVEPPQGAEADAASSSEPAGADAESSDAGAPSDAPSQPAETSTEAPTTTTPDDTAPLELVPPPDVLMLDSIEVEEKALPRLFDAAHVIDERQLEAFERDDVERVLAQVPGVYLRTEDGYGLRPNIGLRGASSERSSKVTLMEDGILLAPAPYSAPAAYYFPLSTRLVGLEVLKGPSTVQYGPNTIGGAVNLTTRGIPQGLVGGIDLGVGQHRTGKLHGHWGYGNDVYGVLLEAVHLETTGFKQLDGGGDTGFAKNELMLKGRYALGNTGPLNHALELKLGYADEVSDETYLGLSQTDFEANPYRRYAASQRDKMRWFRRMAVLSWVAKSSEAVELRLSAYHHDMSRTWLKLNGFQGGPSLSSVLESPESGSNAIFAAILRGSEDSDPSALNQRLLLGRNHREYLSQGVQLSGAVRTEDDWLTQDLRFGVRLHADQIDRDHSELAHLMQRGTLVKAGSPRQVTADNLGRTRALAVHLIDKIGLGQSLFITPGIRFERILTNAHDRLSDERQEASYSVFAPGVGAAYRLTPWLSLMAGVHQGFSPVTPGQDPSIELERSTNYEAGFRLERGDSALEVIGFFHDYDNLIGECTFSTGCPDDLVNAQYNGGAVHILGLEAAARHSHALPAGMRLHGELSYTLTRSEFLTSFISENPQFGEVEAGDALPYVPVHQGALTLGLTRHDLGVWTSLRYVGEMRDNAGQGPVAARERIAPHVVFDVTGSYDLTASNQLYVKLDNALGQDYVASRRPFGLRPGKPFELFVGYKHWFGEG